jgi:hypothetical protein
MARNGDFNESTSRQTKLSRHVCDITRHGRIYPTHLDAKLGLPNRETAGRRENNQGQRQNSLLHVSTLFIVMAHNIEKTSARGFQIILRLVFSVV